MYTTFTIFRYAPAYRLWALKQMGTVPRALSKVKGLSFSMLMGSGRGLVFSLLPDWSRYVLLATWHSEEAATDFFERSPIMTAFQQQAQEIWTVSMVPLKAHGFWAGTNPFQSSSTLPAENSPIVVLTRASIRVGALWSFWKNAPLAAAGLQGAKGLIFSCGVGELPIIRQATLSIWEDTAAMKSFAYGSNHHKDVMLRKQQQDWYWEELFARFLPVGTAGSYLGSNPLEKYPFLRSGQ